MADSITITREWFTMLESLPTVQSRWNVLYAAARFAFDGVKPDGLNEIEKAIFAIIKPKLLRTRQNARYYSSHSKTSTESATESATESDAESVENFDSDSLFNIKENQGIFKQDNTIDSFKVLKKEKEIKSSTNSIMREKDKSSPEKRKIFVPPTLEEVRAYCKERRNAVNPEEFYAYYQCKDWQVGRSRMKDWRAAVRYWEQKMYEDRKSLSQKRDYSGI